MAGKKISELTALAATFGATDLFEISKASGGGFVSRKITGAEMTSSLPGTTYTAGDGLDLTGTVFSTDLKANGGLVIESTELAVDLGASSITGTLAVGDGGTGASTLADGGILLGSGTGAVTAMAALGDGVIVVGDGATDPVTITAFTASDGTLKHEIGGIETDISAITTGDILAGASAGTISIVAASGASDGDVLTIQADGTCDWEAGGGGGASTLDDLTNVTVYDGNATAVFYSMVMANGATGDGAAVNAFSSTSRSCLGILANAGNSITDAFGTMCIGYNAGTAITTGSYNVAIGYQSFSSEDTGANNVMLGTLTGYSQNGGADNTYLGHNAGVYNVTGIRNVCIGSTAGFNMKYRMNTLIGFQAGYNLGNGAASTGQHVVAIGSQAGYGAATHQGAGFDVFVGSLAGYAVTTGGYNTVVGSYAGDAITEGLNNVIIGYDAGDTITTGDKNIAIGNTADCAATVDKQIAIGDSVATTTASTFVFGSSTTLAMCGEFGTANEAQVGINLGASYAAPGATLHVKGEGTSSGTAALLIEDSSGTDLLKINDDGSVSGSVSLGASTLDGLTDVKTTSDNSMWIMNAGQGSAPTTGTLSSANDNFAALENALNSITSGDDNVCIGLNAGTAITSAGGCIAIGNNALAAEDAESYSIAIGYTAGTSCNSAAGKGGMVAIGYLAGNAVVTPRHAVYIGEKSGQFDTGGQNVFVGYQAGVSNVGGQLNVAMGYQTDVAAGVSSQIAIGYSTVTTGQYAIAIGNDVSGAGDVLSFGKSGSVITSSDFDTGTVAWSQSSDIRKKKNIKDDNLGLEFIDKLRTVSFEWKPSNEYPKEWNDYNEENKVDTETVHHGFIAQEVKEALESCGMDPNEKDGVWSEDEDGMQRLSSGKLILPLVKAVQELSARIKELENK